MQTVRDADRQGCCDEGIDEALVLCIAGFDFQPFSEALKGTLNVQDFADHCADGQTADDQHGAAGGDSGALHGNHLLQCPCDGNKQRADAADLRQGILCAVAQKPPEQGTADAACQNSQCIENGSKSNHSFTFCFLLLENRSAFAGICQAVYPPIISAPDSQLPSSCLDIPLPLRYTLGKRC